LAKQYGTESSPRFVNGALGKATVHPKRVLKLISNHLGTDKENLLRETLLSDLNATDLEVSDLMIFLEKELQLTLPPKTTFTSVGDIMDFVEDSID
jgi:acyl carrier protein